MHAPMSGSPAAQLQPPVGGTPGVSRLAWWWSTDRRMFAGVLGLALLLRLLAMVPSNYHHPDEIWQYLEPAHRLVFGHWVVAWEYRDGIRTWLIPALLAMPMRLGAWLAPDGGLTLALPRLMLVLLSLSTVACATGMGMRLSRLHGAMAGVVAAIWAELVYFGPRAMSEPVAMALFFPAALLLTRPLAQRTRATYAGAGLLLGLCFSARFQLAPALFVLAAWACGLRWRAWLWLTAGGLLGLGVDAAVDMLVAGQPPLRWIYANFHINLVEQKSASFGTKPAYWYLTRICNQWRLAALGIVPLAILGARRYPVLLAVALVNLLMHSLIPHKEYRFVLLSTTLLVVLAAFGTVDALQRRAAGDEPRLQRLCGQALLLWLLASLLVATTGPVKRYWKSGRPLIAAMQLAGADPDTCGMALYRPPNPLSAAYALYGRQTPIYLFDTRDDHAAALRYRSAYDTVLSVAQAPPLAPEYALLGCSSKAYCVYRRAGGCTGEVPREYEVNAVLTRLGK